MDCAVEESEIRRALDKVEGLNSLNFELKNRMLVVRGTVAAHAAALDAIRKAGFQAEQVVADEMAVLGEAASGSAHPAADTSGTGGIKRLAVALALAIGAEAVELLAPETQAMKIVGMALAAAAIWMAGWETYAKGFRALRHGKLNINALMSVAVTGAFVIGQWPEAAMVMALYAIAELIEARAADRARNAISGLLALAPETADVLQPNGAWLTTPSPAVVLESIVRIRPGERVPLDGVITRGRSAINQAPVTGESLPVDKAEGDPVYAGTINETGELQFRVTAAASNTTLARIIEAVEQAQGTQAPTQRFVDRFAAIYTPAIFVVAVAVALGGPLLLGMEWLAAVYKALVLLVVACPCALVISTPVTVVSALAAGARRGILIKGGVYLENARSIKAVALDKTGTITEGKPKLVDWQGVVQESADLLSQLAASLAGRSDHPVSRAIAQGLTARHLDVDAFAALAGRGVEGVIDGRELALGNPRLFRERNLLGDALRSQIDDHEKLGRTVTLLGDRTRVLALFAVADTIKASSKQAVADLIALGVAPVMLTGDNQPTAQTIAKEAGIEIAKGDLLPEHKLEAIKALKAQYGTVAMTGDGINDAPALAQADIGYAMGGAGTDIAMEAADVVVMNDDLGRIPESIKLSRRTHAILLQNITLALGIKGVFMVLTLAGSATMWMAVFADMGATLLVVANGLRLLRLRHAKSNN